MLAPSCARTFTSSGASLVETRRDRHLKILYVGYLWQGSTSSMRMEALARLGHEVASINTTVQPAELSAITRLGYRAAWRFGWALDVLGTNERLLALAAELSPDVIWVDKGLTVTHRTLRALKTKHGATLIHYNPDDPFGGFGVGGWRTFLDAIPAYDVHFVPRRVNVEEYARYGARRIWQALPAWGYDPDVHRPIDVDAAFAGRFGGDVGFVGSFEQDRAETMLALAASGAQVRIVGPWPEQFLHERILHSPGALYGQDYTRALRSCKIALGFLRKKNRDQHTSRSIEIPACGVFMLAERSPEHLELFEEGKEAEYFSETAELIDKVRYYLREDRARERIAAAGYERCMRSGYDNMGCLKRMIAQAVQ